MPDRSDRLTGALFVVGACVCWSSGGILVRLLDLDGVVIVFWRSLFMALTVALALLAIHRHRTATVVRAAGWPALLSGLLLSGSFIGYIMSLTYTDVANTMIVLSASPLIAAVLARLLLKERLTRRSLLAIGVAMAGIALMFGHGIAGGGVLGEVFALLVAVTFGVNIVVLRRWRGIDMVPATMIAGVLSAAMTAPWAVGAPVTAGDLAVLAVLGCFQLGLGLFLFVRGSRRLGAAELGLLTLLETVLAPLWVWIGIGETPSAAALLGGALVLTAVVGFTVSQRPPAPPAAAQR